MPASDEEMNSMGAAPVQRGAKVWTALNWNRERERAHRAFGRYAAAIADADAKGMGVNRTVRGFLGDPKVRLSAAMRALGGRSEPAQAFALRNRLNLWAADYPAVEWYLKPKSNHGFRAICILPPELKAAHYMLAAAIAALLPETSTLYGIPRRGVADALRELKSLQKSGFVHLATSDIVNCFPSIDPDALYQLPLPMEVTRQALDYRSLTFRQGTGQHPSTGEMGQNALQAFAGSPSLVHGPSHRASGPTGLLQGSPASNIILAWLLKDIPTSDDARVMLCFDNVVVAARTPERSREMMETLTAYFRNSPAGPLAMCEATYADNQPIEFLGGLLDPTRCDIGIASGTLTRFERLLCQLEQADQDEQERIRAQHRKLVAEISLYRSLNPFDGQFPTDIWHAFRDFFAGLPFLDADCPELLLLLETTAVTVDARRNGRTSHIHQNLFAPDGTREAKMLRGILRHHPRGL